MTENEAIKVLEKPSKHIRMVHKTKNEMEFYTFSSDLVESFETAIHALSEIQQYRAIGTVKELKALKEKNETLKALYYDARKEGANLLANARAKAIDECIRIIEETVWKDTDMLVESIRELKGGAE